MASTDRLTPVLVQALHGSGFVLEGISLTPAGRRTVVRVTVDRDLVDRDVVDTPSEPMSLDDVAEATHLVSAALEDSDAMGEAPYTLEVSSYGVSRPLVERRHYARNVGRLVTFRGEGEPVTGRIRSVDRAALTIEVPAHGKTPARTDTLDLATIREGVVQIEFNRPDEESTGEDEEH